MRQTSLTYPNGTAVDKQYVTGGAIDDVLSRIAKLRYNATDLATMTYLGTGTVVELDDVPGELMRLA